VTGKPGVVAHRAPRPKERRAVAVRQVVRSLTGELLADGEVAHVYRLRDGLIIRMDVEEPQT